MTVPAGSVWARGNLDIAMGTHEVEAEGVEAVSRGAQRAFDGSRGTSWRRVHAD